MNLQSLKTRSIRSYTFASEEMVALASDLQGLVSGFKVSGNGEIMTQNAANVVPIEKGLRQLTA